jgi:heptosyltransferase-2
MRILLIQTAFLGDVILITPMIRELKRQIPEATIDVLVRKGNETLLANNPHISTALIWDKKQKYKSLWTNLKQIRSQAYDEVICIQRYFNAGFLTTFSKAKNKVGFTQNPWSRFFNQRIKHVLHGDKHEVDRNLELIAHLVSKVECRRPELFPTPADYEFVAHLKSDTYYCFAPASVWFTKQLPEHKWVELMDGMPQNTQLYVLGAPQDFDLAERICTKSSHPNTQNLCGKLSLNQSAALMEHAKRSFVNDSGPLHIASAMNARVTAFFCSTIPAFGFGPLSENAQIVQIEEPLACRPCGTHGFKSCPKEHFKCGNEIKVNNL